VFNLLCEYPSFVQSESGKCYKNALINEISQNFTYTDYDKFKQRVVESIDNDEVVVVDSDHLRALGFLSNQDKEMVEAVDYLRSLEFREKLIVDFERPQ